MAGTRVVHWNGRDLPTELQDLPAGTYVLEAVEAPSELTPDEDEGLRIALSSMRADKGRSAAQVRDRIDAILRR